MMGQPPHPTIKPDANKLSIEKNWSSSSWFSGIMKKTIAALGALVLIPVGISSAASEAPLTDLKIHVLVDNGTDRVLLPNAGVTVSSVDNVELSKGTTGRNGSYDARFNAQDASIIVNAQWPWENDSITSTAEFNSQGNPEIKTYVNHDFGFLIGHISAYVDQEKLLDLSGASVVISYGGKELDAATLNSQGQFRFDSPLLSETPSNYDLTFIAPKAYRLAEQQGHENAPVWIPEGLAAPYEHEISREFDLERISEPTHSPEPTGSPEPTESTTETPKPTPTQTGSPGPTEPTQPPTVSPKPTPTSTPSATISPSPTQTPIPAPSTNPNSGPFGSIPQSVSPGSVYLSSGGSAGTFIIVAPVGSSVSDAMTSLSTAQIGLLTGTFNGSNQAATPIITPTHQLIGFADAYADEPNQRVVPTISDLLNAGSSTSGQSVGSGQAAPQITVSQGAASLVGVDIENALMSVQSQRASLLDNQLAQQIKDSQAQNDQIAALNAALNELRTAKAAKTEQALKKAQDALALTDVTAVVPQVDADDFDSLMDDLIMHVQTRINTVANSQQMDMLRLQGLTSKRNDAFNSMSDLLKKLQDSKSNVIGNMRSQLTSIGNVRVTKGRLSGAFDLSQVPSGKHHSILSFQDFGHTIITPVTVTRDSGPVLAQTGTQAGILAWWAAGFVTFGALAVVTACINRKKSVSSIFDV